MVPHRRAQQERPGRVDQGGGGGVADRGVLGLALGVHLEERPLLQAEAEPLIERAEVVVEAAQGLKGGALVELVLERDDGLLADRQRSRRRRSGRGRRRSGFQGGERRERGAGVGSGFGSCFSNFFVPLAFPNQANVVRK